MAPEMLNMPEKGSGPMGPAPSLIDEDVQLKDESMSFCSLSTSLLSITSIIAFESSIAQGDSFFTAFCVENGSIFLLETKGEYQKKN